MMFEIIEPVLTTLEYRLYPYMSKLSHIRKKKTSAFDQQELQGINKQ